MSWAADRADGLTGLTRAPRPGDRVRYRGFGGAVAFGTVRRLDGDLCWFDPDNPLEQAQERAPFIWRFRDGLNKHFTLIEEA